MMFIIVSAMAMCVISMAVTQFTKRWDRKPFNCELCMNFWLSLIVSLLAFNYVLESITFVGVSLFTRQLLFRVWRTMF